MQLPTVHVTEMEGNSMCEYRGITAFIERSVHLHMVSGHSLKFDVENRP